MSLIQAVILGLLQGLTEFIPVSSSAHLVLVPWILGWPNPGLAFDTVLHLGTLVAVLAVFWRDFITLAIAWVQSIRQRSLAVPGSKVAWALIIGSIPTGIMGVVLGDLFESLFGAYGWVAALLLVTGLLLMVSEKLIRPAQSLEGIGSRHALLIGLAQGMAIAPGISRSGATISAGRFLGLSRHDAARFSFLLATPAIVGAGAMQLAKLSAADVTSDMLGALILGFLAAMVSGYLIIRFLLSYLQRHSLLPFAVYCTVVGLVGLIVWFAR